MPDFSTVIGVIGLILGFFSIVYAIYQGIRTRQLQNLIHSQTWDLYYRSQNCFGATQSALSTYKEIHSNELDTGLLETLSKSSAFNQDLFLDTIKHVYNSQPFDYEMVSKWQEGGKIEEDKVRHFNLVATPPEGSSTFIQRLRKFLF